MSKHLLLPLLAAFLIFEPAAATDRSAVEPLPEHQAMASDLASLVGGHAFAVANTKSMLPVLSNVDLVVVRPVSIHDVQLGDIVLARTPSNMRGTPNRRFAHRVIEVREKCATLTEDLIRDLSVPLKRCVRTKGDGVQTPDNWTTMPEQFEGRLDYAINAQTGEIRDLRRGPMGVVVTREEVFARERAAAEERMAAR